MDEKIISIEKAIAVLTGYSKLVADVNLDSKLAFKLAIEALEKQIPKKPKAIKGDFSTYYDCPCCSQYIATVSDGELCSGKKHIYCPVCGQRLLWDGDTE